MKERWFNYRPICLVFGFLLLGSVFSFYLLKAIAFVVTLALAATLALLTLAIYKKKPQYLLVPLISFVVGIGMYHLAVFNFNETISYTPTTIEARIYNVSDEENEMILVECDSCVFNGDKINDNLILYIYDNSGLFNNIEVGSVISFTPYRFYKSDLFYYKNPSARLYANDLKYTASVFISNISYIKTNKNVSEIIKEQTKENLYSGLTNENAEIAYSALFGDKDLLADKQYSVYKLSGVAHLLAVSGLHVGIIVGILNWLLKRIKINNWVKFSIVAGFLSLYSYICGFSFSIVRASIVALVLMLSKILGKEYDSLTSISLAGIIIFVINPFCIFDVGFLLSFGCVLGIVFLNKPIYKALRKFKVQENIAQALAISMATTISIIFIMAYFFKTLNIISIIANVILIPIFTIAFVCVFVVSFLSLLLPFISYLLFPINYIFSFINLVATILGKLAISNFNTLEFNYIAIIVYFMFLLFVSRICTAKYQYKILSTLPMVAILFYCLL